MHSNQPFHRSSEQSPINLIPSDQRAAGEQQQSLIATKRYRIGRWCILLSLLLILWQTASSHPIQAQADSDGETIPNGTIPEELIFLPIVARQAGAPQPTPDPTPTRVFDLIPIAGAPLDRPAALHPDINLQQRGYVTTTGTLELIDVNGDTDPNAPQLVGIFSPPRVPTFVGLYRVYDWDWGCGCRGDALTKPEVTLLAVATTPGEALHIPTRNPNIHAGNYKAMVLYAEQNRITLAYTREDSAAVGYLVHMEAIAVDPALLARYATSNAAGRSHLPALRNGEPFATAPGATIKLAIRDTGTFMDPRTRKDWWMGFIRQ